MAETSSRCHSTAKRTPGHSCNRSLSTSAQHKPFQPAWWRRHDSHRRSPHISGCYALSRYKQWATHERQQQQQQQQQLQQRQRQQKQRGQQKQHRSSRCGPVCCTTQQEASAAGKPKFQPFQSQVDVRRAALGFRHEVRVAGGVLVVRPMPLPLLPATAELLAESFSDSLGGPWRLYTGFLKIKIREYLAQRHKVIPNAVVLVAVLRPDDGAAARELPLDHGSSAAAPEVVVGTAELSFTEATRTRYLTLNPPTDCAYLCNMAVDAAFRRRGYALALLEATDRFTAMIGYSSIYLHLRFVDQAAGRMYRKAGYLPEKEDNPLVFLLGTDRRYLMRKPVALD